MDADSGKTTEEQQYLLDRIAESIKLQKKEMNSEIRKGGMLRFMNESVHMNTNFCLALDYPEMRMEMQVETFKWAVSVLIPERAHIVGRIQTVPFDLEENGGDEFHTDCARNGLNKYRALLEQYNPRSIGTAGVEDIRVAILARLVYGCLRSTDPEGSSSLAEVLSKTVFEIGLKLEERKRQPPGERFAEAVGRYDGKGYEKDEGQAVAMLLDLVDMGYPPAMNYIGAMYFNGEYFETDQKKGFELIEAAAEKGFPKSMLNLSRMYRTGDYVRKNAKKADEYEMRAVEMRYLPAIIKHEMRTGEISEGSIKALIGFAMDHGAMDM